MLDAQRFQDLWQRLDGRDGARVFAELAAAYGEPHRAYHNARHLAECLRHFDAARVQAKSPDVVEMALWFHDAVYDPRSRDNEERSAAWALRALTRDGVSAEVAGRVAHLVRLTRHDAEPDSPDGALLVDVDLAILGSEPGVFAEYDRAIRREYAWVAEEEYRKGRQAVLEAFLKRPRLYHTAPFAQLESSARRNLATALAALNPRPSTVDVSAGVQQAPEDT